MTDSKPDIKMTVRGIGGLKSKRPRRWRSSALARGAKRKDIRSVARQRSEKRIVVTVNGSEAMVRVMSDASCYLFLLESARRFDMEPVG